jgi:hypothetical protein
VAGRSHRPGRQECWIKVKNPAAPAIRREAEEDLGLMPDRRFPPPWTIEEHAESFIVKDATGRRWGVLPGRAAAGAI